ncbi:hypothetical protein ACH3VR_06605 [Microbacterium sp. B2969]|uniref:Uncharacterized protein n=1 Tax=Microbacterium alkaliflavum TaxID=3248839 RepID=A0ABW7Q785_9MICO
MPRQTGSRTHHLGQAVTTIVVSVASFITAVVVVFIALMWGDGVSRTWGISLAVLAPIALTSAALALVVVQKWRVALACGARPVAAASAKIREFVKPDDE